ncbi:uncharacterized protein N7496_001017 [Penicillium cataractarum]|uniref:Zn(2)-C6 fungal-type domain-containing protein n=1 Tax=Penicillium cataractarum TaxID=2100454 RepID=A0A9W9VVI9_9EURO|nr:uncharacterized protein N7496_001017 [Penicillium cataractarum]KAJ5389949.1 hypothetical protein N7496_001017 [Penicillium cataractarum]
MEDKNNFRGNKGIRPGTQPSSTPMPFPPSSMGSFAGWYHASSHSITYFDPYNTPSQFSTQSTSPFSPVCPSCSATGLLDASPDSGDQVVPNKTLKSHSAALSPSTISNMSPTTKVEGPSSPGEGDALASGNAKRRRRWSPEPDYSEQIRERNKKRKRTGQACDRCRIRRSACDPNPKGCGNCSDAGLECKVTDSVTGETIVRGATGRMIAEIETLKARVAALENENAQLRTIHFLS